jgi:hypothetical protein
MANTCKWCGGPALPSVDECSRCWEIRLHSMERPDLVSTILVSVLSNGSSMFTGNTEYTNINLQGAAMIAAPKG